MSVFIPTRKKFAPFDTETTGLTVHQKSLIGLQPRIIEFAGIITDGVEILDTIEFLCNPGIVLEEIITKITGLKDSDLEDKAQFPEYYDQIAKFFSQADVVIAHNLSFDKNMLINDCRRFGLDFEGLNFPKIPCCTVEQTFHQHGRRVKLEHLYEMYVGPYVQKHRAMDDVKQLHQLCSALGVYDAFN
jgi:DNA polymerase III alpha subunit (gram-positive type)